MDPTYEYGSHNDQINLWHYIFSFVPGTQRMRSTLKRNAMPSVFPWSKQKAEASLKRQERADRREEDRSQQPDFDPGIDLQEVVVESVPSIAIEEPVTDEVTHTEFFSQTPSWSRLCIEELRSQPKLLKYYTGLEHSAHFDYVLNTLGPAAYHLKYRWRKPNRPKVENQFLITLIKLRLHSPNMELAYMFTVSEATISNIFVTWINFMYIRWSQIDIFPPKDLVTFNMPQSFRQDFSSTRLIIDGTEVPIQQPGNPGAQQITYSTYKNRNTLKIVVGITPGGLASYIPDSYGGSASDRLLVERSPLPSLFDSGDSIMCDKGFDVQDIFAPFNVTINIPTFMRKKNQLSNKEVLKDRKIASKRVHVERIIGLQDLDLTNE